jgi:UDPglucose 6-dehydrogenase
LGVKSIRAYDPLAMDEARSYFNPQQNRLYEKVSYHQSARAALEGSDALFISTDWEEFRGLSSEIEQTVRPPYLIVDGRRMISDFSTLVRAGYTYLAVGSKALLPVREDVEARTEADVLREVDELLAESD